MKVKRSIQNRKANKIIGFIVEGKSDFAFIRLLVNDYFEKKFIPKIISSSGKASLVSSAKVVISSLIQSGVDHVFILFDTDDISLNSVRHQTKLISEPLEKAGLSEIVTIIPITPFLETWILSGYTKDIEIKKLGLKEQKSMLKSFEIETRPMFYSSNILNYKQMKINNEEFSNFIDKINEKISR